MKSLKKLKAAVLLTATITITLVQCNNAPSKGIVVQINKDPFLNHRDSIPSTSQYSGRLFTLSHNYPEQAIPPIENSPWHAALNGNTISKSNAIAFVDSLKEYVTPSITEFLYNRDHFNADSAGWYEEPWTGPLREAIMGAYIGSGNPPGTFTGLDSGMTTYVLTLYDKRAAYTLGKIWGKTAQQINLENDAAQFKEGSIIVKFAFTTTNYPVWKDMENALSFPIYDTGVDYTDPVYRLRTVTFFQFDIIVKDTVDAPKTGWVFTTLVYDKNAPGNTAWDKMVPLGAMWGNDPGVNSTINPNQPLEEDTVNAAAPLYSRQTLGWGNRLSGPNDGAIASIAKADGKVYTNLQVSACMSCHLSAQVQFNAFLLPGPFPTSNSDTLTVFAPGGKDWLLWYRDLPGNVAFSSGQTGLDFDMVTAFKSIPLYDSAKAHQSTGQIENLRLAEHFRLHHLLNAEKKK
jgi:hypothetical protein